MAADSAREPPRSCLQEAKAASPEGTALIEGERAPAAEQSSAEGADADWDIMKLLPSTVADSYPVGISEGAPTTVLPLDKEVGLKPHREGCVAWPETSWEVGVLG